MVKRVFPSAMILIIAIMTIAFIANAQQQSSPQPDTDAISITLESGDGGQTAINSVAAAVSGRGLYRGRAAFELPGERAVVRFKQPPGGGAPIYFNFTLSGGITPKDILLVRLQKEQNKRLIVLGSSRASGGAALESVASIPFTAIPAPNSIYRVVLTNGLPAGEYGFAQTNSNIVFSFGIDEL
jgi:hypothetical protein